MLPVNCGSHADYQNFFVTNLRKYYPNPDAIAHSTWDIIECFWTLDLSYTDELMRDKYSKAKVKKPQSKGAKASSVEKVTVDRLITQLDHTTFIPEQQPYHSPLQIYKKQFLDVSVSKGLINADSLSVAGDGTPVVTSHRMRSNRICCCHKNGISECSCDRYFSQPDCDIGWDSSRDCWYHGYDLYMLVAADSESDLPVFPLLNPASKHDSHGFLETFFRTKSFLLCLQP